MWVINSDIEEDMEAYHWVKFTDLLDTTQGMPLNLVLQMMTTEMNGLMTSQKLSVNAMIF